MNITAARKRTWEIVEVAAPGDRTSAVFDTAMLWLIILNTFAVVFGTVSSVDEAIGPALHYFELASIVVFSIEYIARIWSCGADERYRGLTGILRFARQPMSIIDLAIVLPYWLPFAVFDLRALRALRLLRLARIAKIGRYYTSLRLMGRVLRSKRHELGMTTALMGLLIVVSASMLYVFEHDAQPDVFSSIPETMWWAVATLTTVGYGDVYPITAMGRILAGMTAALGVGMFALPTGILGAGFIQAVNEDAAQKCGAPAECPTVCPHCGEQLV